MAVVVVIEIALLAAVMIAVLCRKESCEARGPTDKRLTKSLFEGYRRLNSLENWLGWDQRLLTTLKQQRD